MASASDFLKKRTAARQQAESIQSSDKTPLGKNDDGTVTRASNFLRNKAAERRAVIDQQYGKDAYGGSGRYEADKAQGFNSWLESVNGLSSQLGSDYQSRDGKFQSAADFGKYRDDNDARISVMQNRANAYRTYFQDNREIYGEDAVNGVLSTLDQGSKYLEELRGGLNSEYDFWSQFKDENDYNTYQRGKEYAALAEKPDFAEKSQYKSTANGQEKFNAWSGTYSNSGFDDIAYDYINRNEEARSRQMLSDIQSNASLLGLDNSERREMTDDEIATFNYLYAQDTANGDAEHKNAYAYIDYLTGDLNYRQRAKAEEEWATYAKEHPVGSSAFSVLESPLKGLSYLGQAADYLSDGEIDQNAGYNKFSYINSAIRDEVNTIVEDNWGGVGSFAYQTGMSMGDFLLNTAITGGNQALSLAIMGTGAAADATISAKDRGLSDNQAFALGTIAGAAEIVTEKVSLDALLDKTALTKSAMGYFLKNTLAEGSEEVGSDIINLVADVLISKDKSEWQTSIDAYEAEGMTEKEAFWRAVRDQAENMGLDFLGGAVSGGVMSGAGIAINAGLNEYGARRTGAEFQAMGDDVVQATIQEGLASDPSTQSYKLAVQLQQKLDAGQTLTNAEIGRLYQANVQAIDAEDGSGDLLLRAAEEVTQKGRVTNNTAIDILSNPTAINTLTQEAGLNISEDMSKSQQRKAVKSAVATLARAQSDVSTNARETAPTATEARQAATQETVRPAMQVEQQRPAAQQAYDIRRVRDAAASLGENGAKALSVSYDGSVRADDYYAGFASYYEAGISGIDMDKVQSRYAAQLNQAQRFAAYSAGQNDAAASLALEREGVKSATVYGDEAGFVQSEHSASLPKETVRFYNSLARAAGVKIQMAEATGKGGANGWYSNGIIHIANDAENPGTVVAKHEITHRMQEMAPEAYRKYRDYAMSALTERDGSTASIVEQYKSRYAEAGVNLSTEQAMDEIAADFTEALTVDPARFETLAKENRSAARKLLDAVRDFIRKVKSLFKGNKTAQNQAAANAYGVSIDTLEEAARLWEEALKATSEQTANKNAAQTDGGTKFSIKRTSQMTLAQQLKMFYDGKMASSDAFYFGVTPAVLEKSGFDALPLAMTIGDFRKSTQKKHNIPRRVLKNLMGNLASPLFSFGSGDRAGIVLNDIDGDGYTLLAALERGADMDRKPVNVINSLYGLEHPAEWIKNQIDSGNEFVLYDEKRANAFLQTYGYMASVGDGIRSTGESVTQNGAEVKSKFSLKTPVEETDKLLALHNKDENSILAAIKLGGLPMPSIAIVKARDGHTKYGPISLVFSKDTIDPQLFRANKVYGGDAWTPTAPRVDYPVNSKKASQVERELHRLAGDVSVAGGIFGNSAALRSIGIDDTSTRSTAELAEKLASTDTVRAAYLADQGKSLEPVKMDKVWDKFGNDTLQKVVDRLGVNTLAEIEANLETGESVKDALGENAEVIRDILRDYYREQGEPMLRRMAVKRHWTDAEINERRQTRIDNSMDGVSIFTLEDIVHHAWDMYQDGGATKGEIDRMATSDALRSAVDDHAVEEWIAGKLDGLLGEAGIYNGKDPYTPSGNLRSFSQLHYAYTLENIVKAMKEGQEERGGNTWGASAKTLQSVATPEYRSIQEIKADSGRLGMDEGAEYEAKLQAIDDQIGSIITKIKQGNKAHSDNSFVESDIIGSILMETSKGKRTVDAIMRAFSKEGYKISSQTAQDIQAVYQAAAEMPTGYFEAKPQRAVGFDEVLAAVIPDDSSKKLRDGLEQAGVRMLEYKTGDDADRLAKINSVEGARFSLKTVPPVKPTSDDWRPGATFDEVKAAHPTLFALDADEADTRNPTQISGTVKSYRKIYDALQAENFDGTILDASSGLGYGTRAGREEYGFDVDDIEPFPDAKYQPNYTDYSALDKTYDVIISNAVLNVMPQDLRDAMVVKIGEMLNPGGRAFINVRGTDVKNAGSKVAINDDLMEYFISNTGSYQKGFTSKELVSYLKDALGDGFTVEPTRKFGAVSAIVTRDGDRMSLKGRDILQENAALQEENRLLREQMKDYIALQRRNGTLQESRDYWRGQTRRTQRVTTDKKAVTAAAKQLIQNYGADIAVKDIRGDLQSLYDYIASGYDGKDELTYTEARRRAEDIAGTLVSNAVAVNSDMYDEYSDLRDYLRTTKIIYGKEYHGDIADYGDFRKRQFGRLNLGSEGHTNIDQVYQELSSRWPEFFSEQEQTHPTDQLLHIVEVLDGISEINEYNPFSHYMDQAVTGAANEIMETFFDLPQTRKTFADQQALKLENAKAKGREQVQKVREKYATRLAEQKARSEERLDQAILGEKMAGGRELAKQKRLDAERMKKVREQNAARLAELREQNRQRVQNAIAKEREARERQMGALKDRYAAKDAAGRERRAARELRAKITRHASALSQKLLRPSDQHHIPEAMRGSVAAMLESINQESQYTLDENGKRVKDGSGTPTKRTEAFRALKEQYAKIVAEGGDMVIDPSLLGSDADGIKGGFDAVIAMKDTKLADMSVAQLQTVWQVVKAVEHSVNTAGKVLSKAKYARTADWAQALSIGTSSRRAKNSLTRNHALIDLETPYTFFSHYGEAGKAVYRMLRDAQDQQQLMVDHVAEEVRKIVDPKTVKKLEATTHTFTTERGEKLTLSTAQVMELYELVKRKQAHDHLLKGGVVQPEIKTSQIRRGTDSIRLTEGDLVNITGTLTPEQVKIADGLQGLTRGVLADYGNKASMEAYGYKKFTESDYWPIKSAKEGLHSNIEKGGNNTRSIKNIGMAKTTMPHASNALDLAGIFTTFANHASDMTDYASWLCTMEDINRLFNYQFRDEEGNPTGKTIKGLLDRVGGPGSQKYWHNLMEDIQNGINAPGDSPMWDIAGKTIGGFKGAAVGANIRVVIQQPTAFFRAAAVLDPQDMARGLARGVTRGSGWKKALQYSPIAMRKDAGGFDISSPYKMTETLFDNRTNVRKLNDALSTPAGAADAVTWGKLWNACEWATAREHQGLTKGSEAFYRQTAKLFAEVIDQTQVVDGVLQRSNIMRSSNAVVKQATSFMGEPIMSLNLLMRAYDQVRYEQNSQKRGKAIKTMGRAATALVVTNVVNALAQSLIDAMRDDDEDKKYWERFQAAFTGISGDEETPWEKAWNAIMEGNVGSNMNPLGQIPFVKDALSIMQGYDVSRTEMEIVSDLIQAGQTAIQSADGQGKRTRAYALKGLLAAGAKMFGIPASNLARDMWGLARSAAVETGNIPLQYEMEKAIYNISNTGNKNRYYAILYRALEQGDMDTYQHIRDDLMNSMGVDGASIDSAMRSRYNKAVEKDPDYTLPQRARDLIGSRDKYAPAKEKEETFGADDLGSSAYRAYSDQRANDYRSMADDLTSSPIFQGMDDETRDKVLKAAYDLADKSALADHSGGQYEVSTKWMAQADDAEAQGIEPWEYVLFHTAYNEMEGTKDADGKTVKGEAKSDHVREWLEDFSSLTDEQRAFLWGTVYTSEW